MFSHQFDFKARLVRVNRLNNGVASTQPIRGTELSALRELRREYQESAYVFVIEREGPMTPATERKLITRASEFAKLRFATYPHMLRHSCGYKLAIERQDTHAIGQYLGLKNIRHTVRLRGIERGEIQESRG